MHRTNTFTFAAPGASACQVHGMNEMEQEFFGNSHALRQPFGISSFRDAPVLANAKGTSVSACIAAHAPVELGAPESKPFFQWPVFQIVHIPIAFLRRHAGYSRLAHQHVVDDRVRIAAPQAPAGKDIFQFEVMGRFRVLDDKMAIFNPGRPDTRQRHSSGDLAQSTVPRQGIPKMKSFSRVMNFSWMSATSERLSQPFTQMPIFLPFPRLAEREVLPGTPSGCESKMDPR